MADVELNIHAQITDLRKGLDKTQKQLKNLQTQSTKTNKKMQSEVGKTTKVVDGFYSRLVAVFSIGAAVQLTKSVIAVRKEFATFEAVLQNTLGSAQAANREFDKIKRFAAETPFSVRELTDSFVRLVNQGFKPTSDQMRKLGDLASSTGKEFIQLTEAIIDAQTGEFERLKEFGIRASKQGDQVTFTFKGIETQVNFTADAIQGYILSLGDMEGVSGAMEAIAGTLEGQISMLTDSWDELLNVMGQRSEGVFSKVITFFKETIDNFKTFNELADPELAGRRRAGVLTSLFGDDFDESELAVIGRYIRTYSSQIIEIQRQISTLQEQGGTGMLDGVLIADKSKLGDLIAQRTELQSLVQTLVGLTVVEEENVEVEEKSVKSKSQLAKERAIYLKSLSETAKLEAEEEEHFAGMIDGFLAYREEVAEDSVDITEQLKQEATDRTDHEIAEMDRLKASRLAQKDLEQSLWEARGVAAIEGLELIASVSKENAGLQKAIAITQAIINGALAVTKIQSQAGVLAPPLIVASILTTLAQIATIRQQKFARGHFEVLGGDRHAQGGVNIGVGEAEQGEGLAVFSRMATQKYGKFLPAFVKAINENEADVTGYSDGAYMIHLDDKRQVEKLEDIKQLLTKPEIRYEKGYRIEMRKGQVTKVKI